MSLPVLTSPEYSLTVPSTSQEISFRPFLVKEEKILLMAKESNDQKEIVSAMKNIISSCTFNKVDVNTLATFDIEYIFLNIRANSVGKLVDIALKCNSKVEGQKEPCKGKISMKIDLSKIKVEFPEGHSKKIKINDTVGCVMKYPSFDTLTTLGIINEDISGNNLDRSIYELVASCMESVWNNDEVHYTKDISKDDLNNFLDTMTSEQFKKFKEFFETMPALTHTVNYKCPSCGKEDTYTFKGITDFFG